MLAHIYSSYVHWHRRTALLSLILLFCLALLPLAMPARAGNWQLSITSFSYTHLPGGKNPQTPPSSTSGSITVPEIIATPGPNSASVTANITVTGTWIGSGTAPSNVILETSTTASAHTETPQLTSAPSDDVNDGYGDAIGAGGTSSGIHYFTETGNTWTQSIKLKASSTDSNPQDLCFATAGIVTFSIVSGNWDGPYYFHYGHYTVSNQPSTPWYNNTAAPTPAITDISDSTNSFSLDQNSDSLDTAGSITPVWFWNGPDLGVPPPPFEISVDTDATIENPIDADTPEGTAEDGQGDTEVSPPHTNLFTVEDTKTYDVQVQSDAYEPDEGNGYWAIGPTISMEAFVFTTGTPDLTCQIDLFAYLIAGLNGD